MYIELNFPETTYKSWSIENFQDSGIQYQRLKENGVIKMINTPEIVKDFVDFLKLAEGDVLINGLGMGMCNVHLLQKPKLKSLTVIEFDKDLVDFISPFFEEDDRCEIINEDAFTYTPPVGKKYDFVWHDIWTLQSASNYDDFLKLKAKYAHIANWQGAWREEEVKEQAKKRTYHHSIKNR